MLEVQVNRHELHFGASLTLRFLRVSHQSASTESPTASKDYGICPVYCVKDCSDEVPASWRVQSGVLVPVPDRESVRISLSGRPWKPNAVTIGADGCNVLTGMPWSRTLGRSPQNYLVCPDQTTLDDWIAGDETRRPFMPANEMPVGEEQAGPGERFLPLQIIVYEAKQRKLTRGKSSATEGHDPEHDRRNGRSGTRGGGRSSTGGAEAGFYGPDIWSPHNYGHVCVYLVNGPMFQRLTGHDARAVFDQAATDSSRE